MAILTVLLEKLNEVMGEDICPRACIFIVLLRPTYLIHTISDYWSDNRIHTRYSNNNTSVRCP